MEIRPTLKAAYDHVCEHKGKYAAGAVAVLSAGIYFRSNISDVVCTVANAVWPHLKTAGNAVKNNFNLMMKLATTVALFNIGYQISKLTPQAQPAEQDA